MSSEHKQAKVEIDTETLVRLLKNRQLCAAELRCLDQGSKDLLRKICLLSCL